ELQRVPRAAQGVQRRLRAAAQHRVDRRRPAAGQRHRLRRQVLRPRRPRRLPRRRPAPPPPSNWDLCQAAADAVLRGDSLRSLSAVPAAFTERDMAGLYGNVGTNTGSSSSLHSSPENSTSAPARKRSKNNCGAAVGQQVKLPGPGPVLQSCELDLCLTPLSSPLAGGRRGGASDEYSTTTCCEEASGDAAEAGAPPLLNLF
uniref:Uncharacterized protein n=1 Tax=Aegilops tauschii subsp. strangulata TaxID=200361 RepID=A0A453HEI0_AEGTS